MFFLTAVCLYFLKTEFRTYIGLRQRYLQQRKAHMRTIMLDVPSDARSNAILETYFGYLYPGSVLTAVCTQVGELFLLICFVRFRCVLRWCSSFSVRPNELCVIAR